LETLVNQLSQFQNYLPVHANHSVR
jgi:hypothetical protein